MNQNLAGLYSKGTILQHGTTGDTTTFVGYLPSGGQNSIALVCLVTMANAADMTITVKTADDSAGTNATALVRSVPIYKGTSGSQMAKQTESTYFTETAATGAFVYVFEIPPTLIPSTKYVGVYANAGNAANIYSCIALEDTYLKA